MRKFFRDNRGAAMVEYSLVALPVVLFIFGIIQVSWIIWIGNTLTVSVDAAARCGAVQSTTSPCAGSGSTGMITTANKVFGLGGASFSANTCANGVGLIGTYTISLLFVTDLTLTAKSCYPTVS